jgi:broad specificity phosphatase PhoE
MVTKGTSPPSSTVMSAQILLIRHGQSTFNAIFDQTNVDPMHFDAPLSPHGRQQVDLVRQKLAILPPPDLVICSPLTRAIETTLGLFGDSKIPITVTCRHRERLGNSCDVGRSPSVLAAAFPMLSFQHLRDPWWHKGEPDMRGVPVEPEEIFLRRVEEFRTWMGAQEGRLAVVGHGTFFHRLTGLHFENCEMVDWNPTA